MSCLPKIVLADRFSMTPTAAKILQDVGIVVWAPDRAENRLMKKVKGAVVVAAEYNRITSKIMDVAIGTLRGIVAYGVGYNHIDVAAATERGLYVTNCKGSNAEAVAEHAIALILNLSRGVHIGDRFVRTGLWKSEESGRLPTSLRGKELAGRTIGIIGMGEIGKRVARIAKGFQMKILVFDPYLSEDTATRVGAQLTDLMTLMKEADYVSVHVPLSAETEGLIGRNEIAAMKPTAYLINTARGAVINQEALVSALRANKMAGAALDVFETEPLLASSILLKLHNIIVTPHIAGFTEEAIAQTSRIMAEECARIARGEVPVNLINRRELAKRGFLVQ